MKQLLWALLLVSFNIFAAPVDINKASAQEMSESLKGVGLKKAVIAHL
jgi:competence protein ComEA